MMETLIAAMAVVIFLLQLSIDDHLNNQKANDQQALSSIISYASESAGTSKVPRFNRDVVQNCNTECGQVALLNGIDWAEALCGPYGIKDPFSASYVYEKCAKREAVEGVTAEATEIVNDLTALLDAKLRNEINSRKTFCIAEGRSKVDDILQSRALEQGLDMSFARRPILLDDECFSTKKVRLGSGPVSGPFADVLDLYSQMLNHALFNVKRVVNEGSDPWRNPGYCEWLTDLPFAEPFCNANKNVPGCKQFLDIYGNCEKIIEVAEEEKNEPALRKSMPVYAPVVDEPTPEDMPEVDVDKQKDELAQEEKKEKPAEPAQDEEPHLTRDMFYSCGNACNQVAVLNGIDSAEAICGVFGDYDPFSITYAYEKCARPEAVEGVTAEANKIVNDATAEFEAQWSPQEQQQNRRDVPVVVDMIHSRAKEHGLDLSPFWSADKITGSRPRVDWLLEYYGRDLEHALFNVKRVVNEGSDPWRNPGSCEWLTDLLFAEPFCNANKNVPDCKQFLDIYGNCEKILADSANKNEL